MTRDAHTFQNRKQKVSQEWEVEFRYSKFEFEFEKVNLLYYKPQYYKVFPNNNGFFPD